MLESKFGKFLGYAFVTVIALFVLYLLVIGAIWLTEQVL